MTPAFRGETGPLGGGAAIGAAAVRTGGGRGGPPATPGLLALRTKRAELNIPRPLPEPDRRCWPSPSGSHRPPAVAGSDSTRAPLLAGERGDAAV